MPGGVIVSVAAAGVAPGPADRANALTSPDVERNVPRAGLEHPPTPFPDPLASRAQRNRGSHGHAVQMRRQSEIGDRSLRLGGSLALTTSSDQRMYLRVCDSSRTSTDDKGTPSIGPPEALACQIAAQSAQTPRWPLASGLAGVGWCNRTAPR